MRDYTIIRPDVINQIDEYVRESSSDDQLWTLSKGELNIVATYISFLEKILTQSLQSLPPQENTK